MNLSSPDLDKEALADSIIELQESCSEYVTVQTREQIMQLLDGDNAFYEIRDGSIVVSAYRVPLLNSVEEKDQIFKYGGFSVRGFPAPSFADIEAAISFMEKHLIVIETENLQAIIKTENPALSSYLGRYAEELTYEECLQRYPQFLEAYVSKSVKPRDYYKTQNFFIRPRK